MRVEFHHNLQAPQSAPASRVVIYDDHGNPLAAAIEIATDTTIITTADQPDFNQIMESMGIRRTVVVRDTPQRSLPDIRMEE
jgi:hypothetical protein